MSSDRQGPTSIPQSSAEAGEGNSIPSPATEAGWSAQPRPVHGGIRPAQLRALGLDPAEVLDFSASVSPLGPPPGLWDALQQVDLTAYPDPECLELREALAQHHGTGINQILVGNGSTELIHLLARAFLAPPRQWCKNFALEMGPTYGEYAGAGMLAGVGVAGLLARRERGFRWNLAQARMTIARQRPSLVFLCNPNNPTGVYLAQEEVAVLAEICQKTGSLLVLDEAYLNFVDGQWDSLSLLEGAAAESVILLRSMTKDYALTGLRLGYSLASPNVTASLARLQPDWSVNSLAQAAGLVALADADYLPAARQAVNAAKTYLTEELNDLGFQVLPSAANFLLVEVGNGAQWRDRLMRRGIFVRDCASFDLPDCIRIGIRGLPDCRRLVRTITELIHDKPAGKQ